MGTSLSGSSSADCFVLSATLDAQGPLPSSGEKVWRWQPLRNVLMQAKPIQTSPGQDHGIQLAFQSQV